MKHTKCRLVRRMLLATLSLLAVAHTLQAQEDDLSRQERMQRERDTTYQRMERQLAEVFFNSSADYKAMDNIAVGERQYCLRKGYIDAYYIAYANQILYYKSGMNFYYAEQLIDEMFEELKRRPNKTGQFLLYNTMGSYYSARGLEQMAEKYFKQAIGYANDNQEAYNIGVVYHEMANLYLGQRRFDEGMKCIDMAIGANEKMGKEELLATNYGVKCQLAYQLGQLDVMNKSYARIRQLIDTSGQEHDDIIVIASALHAAMNKRVDLALQLADSMESKVDALTLKKELYAKNNNWKAALACQQESNWLADSINQFGFGEQAAALSADMDHALLEVQASQVRSKWLTVLAFTIAIIVLVIAIALKYYLHVRRRRVEELRQINEKLYATKLQTEQDVEAKARFIQHIGKDIKKPLVEISVVTTAVTSAKTMTDEEKKEHNKRMDNAIQTLTRTIERAIKAVSVVLMLVCLAACNWMDANDRPDAITGEDASRLPKEVREMLPQEYMLLDTLRQQMHSAQEKGDYHQAYLMAEAYRKASDSITQHKQELALGAVDRVMENVLLEQQTAKMTLWRRLAPAIALAVIVAIVAISLTFSIRNRKQMIRDLQKKNDELTQANTLVAEAAERKNEFLRQMSHEMRTPLNAISGFSQLVLAAEVEMAEEEKQDSYRHILQNRNVLERMIDNMVDISQIESRKATVNWAPVPLSAVCHVAVEKAERQRPDGKDGKVSEVPIVMDMQLPERCIVNTDANRLCDMIVELLINALKFAQEGTVTLKCTPQEISVTDMGPGIPEGKEYTIFERFEKLDDYTQGAGIGLYHCRLQAGLLGYGLGVDTSHKPGARFVINLPN